MAQTDNMNTDDVQAKVFDAQSGVTIRLENNDFISNADMARDGFDLTLTLDSGESVVIEGYFSTETPPVIMSEAGSALTPRLVNSFVSHDQFAEAGGTTDVSPIGAVKEISGDATVTRTNGNVENLTLGSPIYEGDVIETGMDGAVNMIFIDETEFAVSEDARLSIDEYVFDASTAEGTTDFSILRGVFVFTSGIIGLDDPDHVNIETPSGSIGIRGTIIAGKIDPAGTDTQITVVEGAIVIRNGMGETTLSNQFETVHLTSYESEIVNVGTLDAGQMNQNFGSVSGVSGSLFSAINDTGANSDSGSESDSPASEAQDDNQQDSNDVEAQDGNEDSSGDVAGDDAPARGDMNVRGSGLESKLESSTSGMTADAKADAGLAPQDNTQVQPKMVLQPKPVLADSIEKPLLQTNDQLRLNDDYNPDAINRNSNTDGTTGGGTTTPTTTAPFSEVGNGSAPFSSLGINIPTALGTGSGTSIAALGDLNNDGRADFAFTGTNGEYYIFSNGAVTDVWLASYISGDTTSSLNIAGGGDLNADGNPDLIVGLPSADGPSGFTGNIGIFSGTNPDVNSQIIVDNAFLTSTGSLIGTDVALLGDINADGFSDYAVGFDAYASGDGGILIRYGSDGSLAVDSDTAAFDYIDGNAGELLGISIASAGDQNRDGFTDLVAGTADGNVYLYFGTSGGLNPTGFSFTAPGGGETNFGRNVLSGSDVNNGGKNDFIITSEGAYGEQVHLYTGGSLTLDTTFYTSRTGWEVSAGAMLGDVNGDGIDDYALATSNGVDSDIFIFYGGAGVLPADVDLDFNDLTTFDTSWGRAFTWNGIGSDIELGRVGDVNGDGLDDLAAGAFGIDRNSDGINDGSVKVIYGKASTSVVQDGDAEDANGTAGSIKASANGQALLGDHEANTIDGHTYSGLSVSAGNGNDTIKLQMAGVTHKTIDGGGGYDHLVLSGTGGVLDFTSTGPGGMSLSNIEKITMNNDGQTLKMDFLDLFDLLRGSSNDRLTIDAASGTSNELKVFIDGSITPLSSAGFVGANGEALGSDTNANGYYDLKIGDYTLLIDTDIAVSLV